MHEGGTEMTAGTREEIMVGGMAIRFLLEGEQTGESVAVFEFDVPADAKIAAAHSHDGYDETIYGLEGTLAWTVEGEPNEVGPGEALFIPRGAVHHFENRGEVEAKAIAIATPGIIGPDFFREVAEILDAAAAGPPDLAALAAVMRRHGLTPAA
jgi:quercetin dioxygenase-like cupin family protein